MVFTSWCDLDNTDAYPVLVCQTGWGRSRVYHNGNGDTLRAPTRIEDIVTGGTNGRVVAARII